VCLKFTFKPRNVSQYTTESGTVFQTKGPAQEKRRPAVELQIWTLGWSRI